LIEKVPWRAPILRALFEELAASIPSRLKRSPPALLVVAAPLKYANIRTTSGWQSLQRCGVLQPNQVS
jgi:hypothetical protein